MKTVNVTVRLSFSYTPLIFFSWPPVVCLSVLLLHILLSPEKIEKKKGGKKKKKVWLPSGSLCVSRHPVTLIISHVAVRLLELSLAQRKAE